MYGFKRENEFPKFLSKSPLSRFILQIYLIELDRFFFMFASDFNLIKNLFLKRKNLSLMNYKKNVFAYYPIKLQSFFLQPNFSLINFISNKVKYCKDFFFYEKNIIFLKQFTYVRHLDHVLIGFISSMQVNSFFQKKLTSFVRSNLHLDVKSLKVFSFFDKEISFLGFNIRLLKPNLLNYYSLSKLMSNKKYYSQLNNRIKLYKKLCI